MLSRSAGNPIIIGLGAAAIVAAGAGPAMAAPTPSPSTSSEVPTSPASMRFSVLNSEMKAGETATAIVRVTAGSKGFDGLHVTLTVGDPGTTKALVCPAGSVVMSSGCNLSGLKSGTAPVRQTFTAPKAAVDNATKVKVTAVLTQNGKTVTSGVASVTFTSTKGDPDETSPPVPPTKPKPKPTPSPSLTPGKGKGPSDKKDKNGSGGGAGSNNNSGGSGSGSGSGGSGGYVPPTPNGTFNPSGTKSPQVALPPISAPSPSVAAPVTSSTNITPDSKLRSNEKPVAEDLTFQRMASTQIAWLAALLVAFSLLMTQLRLGRRNGTGAPVTVRIKGTHRRSRRGVFGK
ncbi:hypothetical protein J4573_02625 [Actinomadura barringtoniae]|uniref:Uncharacterized protein n=1 Tax=Actinomadura barringtoniae TaxID=1427535 RepID=A0A939T253_9ACTN|nr:hypothetical protein [Actinomadura barringtoniae]MBO2445973.1 hypothetical protein [Actinomadura barringtoniae]